MTRWLQRRNLRFVGIAVVAVSVVLLGISLATAREGRTVFGSLLGGDYAGFYLAGKMLNEYPADRLYDRTLQYRLFHELLPATAPSESLPYVHPPLVAWFFRPLALLPFRWSYVVWLIISMSLYVTGVRLALRKLPDEEDRRTAFWLALSFEPFIMECWIGGQLTAIALCAVALAMECDRRGKRFAAGLALGIWVYKPTLLVWVLPMLVIGRQWRLLLGMLVSAVALTGVSTLGVGGAACRQYAHQLVDFFRMTVNQPAMFRVWKYIDVRWLLGQTVFAWTITILAMSATLLALGRQWVRPERNRELLWAATLSATLVANIYVGIYDSVLVVASLLLMPGVPRALAVCLYLLPWCSQGLAQLTGFQPYTLALATLVIYQLVLLRRDSLQSPA